MPLPLLARALAAFAIGTSAFVITGLLPGAALSGVALGLTGSAMALERGRGVV